MPLYKRFRDGQILLAQVHLRSDLFGEVLLLFLNALALFKAGGVLQGNRAALGLCHGGYILLHAHGIVLDKQFVEVSSQIDSAFEQCYFDMSEDELKEHILQLVYHMLGVANEIRIISNIRICRDCKSKEECIARQKEVEKFLSEKVSTELNRLLSNKSLRLDLETARELFSLTGGGVRLNGEYVHVQPMKIDEVLKSISPSKHEDYI